MVAFLIIGYILSTTIILTGSRPIPRNLELVEFDDFLKDSLEAEPDEGEKCAFSLFHHIVTKHNLIRIR